MRRAEGEGGRGGGDRAHAGAGEENEGKKGEEEEDRAVEVGPPPLRPRWACRRAAATMDLPGWRRVRKKEGKAERGVEEKGEAREERGERGV